MLDLSWLQKNADCQHGISDAVLIPMAVELNDHVIEDLRACRSTADLVALDERMAVDHRDNPLHRVICDALRNRTVAPVEAARWLATLMDHRNQQLTACLNLTCQV